MNVPKGCTTAEELDGLIGVRKNAIQAINLIKPEELRSLDGKGSGNSDQTLFNFIFNRFLIGSFQFARLGAKALDPVAKGFGFMQAGALAIGGTIGKAVLYAPSTKIRDLSKDDRDTLIQNL